MSNWKARGYVEDSEDTEADEEGDVFAEGKLDGSSVERDGGDAASPTFGHHQQCFHSIDDFVDEDTTDRPSTVRVVNQVSAPPQTAPEQHASSPGRPDRSSGIPLGGGIASAVLSQTEDLLPNFGAQAELHGSPCAENAAGRESRSRNLLSDLPLDDSQTSSLSSLDSFIADRPFIRLSTSPVEGPDVATTHIRPPIQLDSSPHPPDPAGLPSSIAHDIIRALGGERTRNLRKRNPIQLHPYLLEGERYRQSLKARGLKPLKMNAGEASPARQSRSPVEGASDFEPDEETQLPDSAPDVLRSSPPLLPGSSQDEFPDVDVLLHRNTPGVVEEGFKRRKVTAEHVEPPRAISPIRFAPVRARVRPPGHLMPALTRPTGSAAMVVPPPSPPPTSSREQSNAIAPGNDEPDSSSSGVELMDASFITQDQPRPRIPVFELSEDSESYAPPLAWQTPSSGVVDQQRRRSNPEGDMDRWLSYAGNPYEVEEDNRINQMLPPRTRSKPSYSRRQQLQRQQKVTDFVTPVDQPSGRLHGSGTVMATPSGSMRAARAPKRKRQPQAKVGRASAPRLSIVDATKYTTSKHPVPNFVRLAHRRARARQDLGRHSPGRKVFKLATRQDTEDVQTVLQDWAGGLLSPVTHNRDIRLGQDNERRPLVELSGNGDQQDASASRQASQGPEFRSRSMPSSKTQANASSSQGRSERPSSRNGPTTRALPTSRPRSSGTKLYSRPRQTSYLSPWQAVTSTSRPAQLESTVTRYRDGRRRHRPNFEVKLAEINFQYQRQLLEDPKSAKVQLSRYLSHQQPMAQLEARETRPETLELGSGQGAAAVQAPKSVPARRLRKRPPRRLDIQAAEFRQPPPEAITIDDEAIAELSRADSQGETLQGLSAFGSDYGVSFGIVPLELGTYFHESTFIGGGGFANALQADYSQDSRHCTGQTMVVIGSHRFQWSTWNETVSSELGRVIDWSCDAINQLRGEGEISASAVNSQDIAPALRGVTRYLADALSFSDAVDRWPFVSRSTRLIVELLEALRCCWPLLESGAPDTRPRQKPVVQVATCVLVMAYQVYRIAQHASGQANLAPPEELIKSAAVQVLRCLAPANLDSVRSFYANNRQPSTREAGIRDQEFMVEATLIAMHVLGQLDIPGSTFWELANTELGGSRADTATDVPTFERIWTDLFTLLPLQEFDERGVLKVGRRFQGTQENWLLPRKLASRLFKIYQSHPESQSPRFNSYCRVVLMRCHHLITDWGWRKCDKIIGALFDFFASNNLAHLRHEESHGSIRFLEDLDKAPDLSIGPRDRCFHIFLKIVAAGLKRLSRSYPESKMRNIVFRLIPNHGRQYPKGQPVRQEELDSLRNHHDLLCTLYWASPPSCRPSINIIRDLVDAEASHQDACHVNIRAWLNLVRFQLSADEPAATLKLFGVWHSMLTAKLLQQHDRARVEPEADYTARHSHVSAGLASEVLQPSIRADQQAIEAVISDALLSVKSAIEWSRYVEAATALLDRSSTADVFSLFEMRKRGTDKLVIQSLQAVKGFVRKCSDLSKVHASEQASEESQDYGDWSAVMEAATISPLKDAAVHLQDTVNDGIARLLSNAFGADTQPEDSILQEIVDAWVSTAQLLVSASLRQWDDFLGAYSRHSWTTLRNTEQTRKYTAYFMAKVIEADGGSYQSQRLLFLTHWVTCLMERESMLKFQHTFTNALLNTDPPDVLLKNLPFSFRARDGVYSITLQEFSERRLSLISSVLTNMRESVEDLSSSPGNESAERREEYAQLLKRLMAAMKSNYQEVQQGTAISGAYVEFVQAVVGFLQQYTVDICPVDRFFTDAAAFPLPARDPTYVVGRLKNYGLKLSAVRTHKELASFVQSVSVRAAIDDQQSYLSMQLGDAMVSMFEDSDESRPTLRAFLLQAVFPAYIEHAFTTPAGWILARPVLEASIRAFDELLQSSDATNSASVAAVAGIMDNFLDAAVQTGKSLLENLQSVERFSGLHVLKLFIRVITATLVPLDYVYRSSGQGQHARLCTGFFHSTFATMSQHLNGAHNNNTNLSDTPPEPPMEMPSLDASQQRFLATRCFCAHELHETLTRNWTKHEDQYYYVRGNMRKHVAVRHLFAPEDGRGGVLDAIERFQQVFWRMDGLASQIGNLDVAAYGARRRRLALRERRAKEMADRVGWWDG